MSVSTRMGKSVGLLEVEVLAAFGRRGGGMWGGWGELLTGGSLRRLAPADLGFPSGTDYTGVRGLALAAEHCKLGSGRPCQFPIPLALLTVRSHS